MISHWRIQPSRREEASGVPEFWYVDAMVKHTVRRERAIGLYRCLHIHRTLEAAETCLSRLKKVSPLQVLNLLQIHRHVYVPERMHEWHEALTKKEVTAWTPAPTAG